MKKTGTPGFVPPAPAERAEGAELAQMVAEARSSPLFHALLDWIDGMVLVLNPRRQIVLASPSAARLFQVDDPEKLIGLRVGEALGCIHSREQAGGCGTSRSCRYCGALRAILQSQDLDEPTDTEYRVSVNRGDQEQTIKLRVRASKAKADSEDFTLLVLQRADGGEAQATAPTMLDPAVDWPLGVEAFARIRKLGAGGMGSVFLVQDAKDRQYALKTIKADHAESEEVVDRFLKEIRLSIVLDHPNIVKTVRADQAAGGALYMVTEYCSRGTTAHWLQSGGPLPVDLALHWMVGVAHGLAYAWREHRLIHRDIKPDNLLVDDHNQAKIADFGVAKRVLATESKMTVEGLIIGSVLYMAPEQAVAVDDLDVRSDLYALGASFYELLSGVPPFDGARPGQVLARKLSQPAPPLLTVRSDLPPDLAECIDGLLATMPSDRPNDPCELVEQLAQVVMREQLDLELVAERYESPRGPFAETPRPEGIETRMLGGDE